MKYILRAVTESRNQSNMDISSILTKEESRLLHKTTQPPKVPNAYNIFVKEWCNAGNKFIDAPLAYRNLSVIEKLSYQEMAAESKKKDEERRSFMKPLELCKTEIKVEMPDKNESREIKLGKKKSMSIPENSWAEESFKSPTKRAPQASADTSIKSNGGGGTPSKKRKSSENGDVAIKKIKVEKERLTEPERVPT